MQQIWEQAGGLHISWLERLNEAEVTNAINYIEADRQEFEVEYSEVVQAAAEREAYWRKINRG